MRRWILIMMVVVITASPVWAVRIKDITVRQGEQDNELTGYGLVVGLGGTGDDSILSRRAMANTLRKLNIVLNPDDVASKNIASVLVTAKLGPNDRFGGNIDLTVSATGDASSLLGGTLMMTELRGADGQVYATASWSILVGGFSASGDASSIQKNHTAVGKIPGGGTVVREELGEFIINGQIRLLLTNPDVTTAQRMAEAINKVYARSSIAVDAGCVRVTIPQQVTRANVLRFISRVEALDVDVDMPAVVVINEKTGTVVVGEHVGISKVGISHGNLTIIIEEKEMVSQPQPFSRQGTTEKTSRTQIDVFEGTGIAVKKGQDGKEEKAPLVVIPQTVSVSELAQALNAMGMTPRDLISIFQSLWDAGALQAELKIM